MELSIPKGYAVKDNDGIHFHYEDIHHIEPIAKAIFDKLSAGIKKITKPLYEMQKRVYSIRISETT